MIFNIVNCNKETCRSHVIMEIFMMSVHGLGYCNRGEKLCTKLYFLHLCIGCLYNLTFIFENTFASQYLAFIEAVKETTYYYFSLSRRLMLPEQSMSCGPWVKIFDISMPIPGSDRWTSLSIMLIWYTFVIYL